MTQFSLTPDELAQFRAQGFFGPFRVYSPEEARKRYRAIRAELFDRNTRSTTCRQPAPSPITIVTWT